MWDGLQQQHRPCLEGTTALAGRLYIELDERSVDPCDSQAVPCKSRRTGEGQDREEEKRECRTGKQQRQQRQQRQRIKREGEGEAREQERRRLRRARRIKDSQGKGGPRCRPKSPSQKFRRAFSPFNKVSPSAHALWQRTKRPQKEANRLGCHTQCRFKQYRRPWYRAGTGYLHNSVLI